MNSSSPRTSIIIPAFNAEQHIAESIQSVIQQTDPDWELLITDDCSTDSTADIINIFAQKDPRIRYFKNDTNSGAAASRNHSIKNASGRFIAFLDSDDRWTADKLEKQISFMTKNNFPLSYTDYWITDSTGKIQRKRSIPKKINYSKLLKTNYIGCLTAVYDSHILGKQYMPLIKKRQDYGLWLKILKLTRFAYGLDEPLAFYRVHKGSLSANKLDAAKYTWKLYRNVEKLNIIKSAYYFMNYSIRGILRS